MDTVTFIMFRIADFYCREAYPALSLGNHRRLVVIAIVLTLVCSRGLRDW